MNECGDVIEYIGTGIDVTEQKEARAALEHAFEEIKRLKDRLQDENLALREEIDQAFMFEEIVGASAVLKTVLSHVAKVAPTDSTVLISGETGTGKELIARAIHKHSRRTERAFVGMNCAATPPSLIASELFGHEKGAFTGAMQQRRGRFELAHSGTIFLDEIGEIPMDTQIALLRVLQERQVRAGWREPRHPCGRQGDRRDEPRSVRSNRGGDVSIGSLLSAERVSDRGAPAAKTARGYSDAGRVLRQAVRGKDGEAYSPDRQAHAGALRAILVARQHSRTAEHRRAVRHPVQRRNVFDRRGLAAQPGATPR